MKNNSLIHSMKINRFLSLTIALNLLVYTVLFVHTQNSISGILTGVGWIILTGYVVISEIALRIAKNSTLNTEKISNNIFNLNIILTALFLLVITYLTGCKDYLFLCIIPIFQAALEKKTSLSGMILSSGIILTLIASFGGWFNIQYLPVNQAPFASKTLIFLTVFGILGCFGIVLAKTITLSRDKADFMRNIATTDALTGLINRRELDLRLSEEFARAKRHKALLSLALFDIDFFKKINDTYGHPAGDAILQELGQLIIENTRTCDIAARYGGEEFALILPETSLEKAFELMDRLRSLVEVQNFNKKSRSIKITISIGVAQLDLTDSSPLGFYERVDKALYKAKENGRNRVANASVGIPKITLSPTRKKTVYNSSIINL